MPVSGSNITGNIGSHDCTQRILLTRGQIFVFVSQIGLTVAIVLPIFSWEERHKFRDVRTGCGDNVGQPVIERAYTRGHISFSSDTPSASVSARASTSPENVKKRRRYFFIHSDYHKSSSKSKITTNKIAFLMFLLRYRHVYQEFLNYRPYRSRQVYACR